ncbi:SDR family oxidoreductase [Anaeromyxobacter paludicola]|uniref:Pteridine reductase n=1 Tax=Anaeromyxobacter paludicola TaxID=2918171 RepID=A0ABM7XAB4_9BACT|nr:SDR family oxidoreductase [Anaeromyxobacter paludicola]BDG08791.1 pteridine reductase [Anaeromyxobacter paludicola]
MPKRERVALVTGAGVRVGRVIAQELSRAGYTVAAHYHRHRPPRGLAAFAADLSTPEGPAALARAFRARFSRLDLLVNSAAGFEPAPLARLDAEGFDAQMDLNARAPLLLARALLPLLGRARGSIVNVLDVGGAFVPWKGFAAYVSSKAALARATECLALELAPRIRVNGVAPGTVLWPEEYPASLRRELTRRIPLRRAGRPEDVAQAVRYLAEAPYVTGAILPVDGGRRLFGRG